MLNFEDLMNIKKNKYYFSRLLETKDIVPFVGAGMSAGIFPLWKDLLISFDLLEKEKESLNSLIDMGRYEEAASFLFNINKKLFVDTIKSAFDKKKIKINDISLATKKLPQITTDLIITTNLDNIIETLWEDYNLDLKIITPDSTDTLNDATQQNDYCLVKLHGSVEESSKYVLTKEQYDETYGITSENNIDFNKPFPSNLGRIMVSKTLLFLGCSLKSDRTLHVLDSIMRNFNDHIQHYAFLELSLSDEENILTERRLSKYGISVIWFPKNEFEAINTLLENLTQKKTLKA